MATLNRTQHQRFLQRLGLRNVNHGVATALCVGRIKVACG
jgi:hypothetical protein